MFDQLKAWARSIKRDLAVIYLAMRDARTPWYVKALGLAVVGYALSPIDLIPDFIPVLGYLDEVILLPLGLMLVMKLTPPQVLQDARAQVDQGMKLPSSRVAAALIVGCWIVTAGAVVFWWLHR